MKTQTFAALTALFMLTGAAAHADEMPIKGTCVNGEKIVTFTGSRNPDEFSSQTGETGMTHIFMSKSGFNQLILPQLPPMASQLVDRDGFSPNSVGELGVMIKHDGDNVLLKTSNNNFNLVIGSLPGWTCTVGPNLH